MDNKRPATLFGTPLSKSLENAGSDDDRGPVNRRRARNERQQVVTDDQGRRRFHGAFTGGFSAGHYNSVGTSGGFQPRSFVSKRGGNRQDSDEQSSYSHRPEDYMDEEDFGEFGIAPKKIRLAGEYSKGAASSRERGTTDSVTNILKPKQDSIGERILRSMSGARGVPRDENEGFEDLVNLQKSDHHGLGYKPLARPPVSGTSGRPAESSAACNPLVATLKHGQRLKISGEAFGSGVLDDDDDAGDLHHADEYGNLDCLANYDFGTRPSTKRQHQAPRVTSDDNKLNDHSDSRALDDFVLARDVESLEICDDENTRYPRPVISAHWRMPVREEPYVPPVDELDISPEVSRMFKRQVGQFGEKFVASSGDGSATVTKCDYMEGPAGLVQYSDLKNLRPPPPPDEHKSGPERRASPGEQEGSIITIKRQEVEWRPCSLLARHFNVPNPYPDNAFCGVRPTESSATNATKADHLSHGTSETTRDADDEDETSADEGHGQDDERPQVIELVGSDHETSPPPPAPTSKGRESDGGESDVMVVAPEKRSPEVINLLSSSSADESDDDDDDIYGPPLPPSRRTLQALDRGIAALPRSSSSSSQPLDAKANKRRRKKKSKKKDKR